MKYVIYKEPILHIIVEDVLPPIINSMMLKEIERLIPYMQPGKVAKGNTNSVEGELKSNFNLWLFQFYQKYTPQFDIAKNLEKYTWTDKLKEAFKETGDSLFMNTLFTDNSQMLLSKYVEGDHYNWHRDYNQLLTMNYMCATEPLSFSGGDFVIGDWDRKEELIRVPFKNNSMVIFPSRVWHKVTPVQNFNGKNKNGRFTIQYWPGLKHLKDV